MYPAAILEICTVLLWLTALVILLRDSKFILRIEQKLIIAAFLLFNLSYDLCMAIEWTGLSSKLNPLENIIGALIPVLWAFVIYVLLKGISEDELKDAHNQLKDEINTLEKEAQARKKAQEALAESEAKYRALFKGAPDAIFLADPQSGTIIDANPAASALLKRPHSEIVGMNQTQIHPPGKEDEAKNIFSQHSQGLEAAAELIVLRSDGTEVPVEILGQSIKLKDKTILQGVFRDITERKNSEKAIRENEAFLKNAFTAIQDGISILDTDLTVRYTNKVMEQWYKPNMPLVGQKCFVCYHNADKPCDHCPTLKCLESQKTESNIIPGPVDSPIEWLELYSYPLKDSQTGEITGIIEFARDITKRINAAKALKIERDKAQQYLDVAGTVFVVIDTDGDVTLINKKGCEILGYSESEILGKNWFDNFVPENERQKIKNIFSSAIQGNVGLPEYHENRVCVKGGQEKIIAWHNTILCDEKGKITGTLSSGEDITERKKAQQQLQLTQIAMERTSDAVFWICPDSSFAYVNEQTCKALGYTKNELLSMKVPDIDPDFPQEKWNATWQKLKKQKHMLIQSRHKAKDGRIFPVEISINYVEFEGKEYHFAFARDITERKKAEQEIMIRQKNLKTLTSELTIAEEQERRRIAVGIHDDIGAKLALAKIELQSLRKSVKNEKITESLNRQLNTIDQIIKDIRSLTFELSNPVLYEVGLVAAVESWLKNNIKGKKGVKYKLETNKTGIKLNDKIKVTMFNGIRELITNIIKHANAGNISIHIEKKRDYVKAVIEDDGGGFDISQLTKHTTKKGNFGLFNLKEKLEYLGGQLNIDSQKGQGTTVTIIAPLDGQS